MAKANPAQAAPAPEREDAQAVEAAVQSEPKTVTELEGGVIREDY